MKLGTLPQGEANVPNGCENSKGGPHLDVDTVELVKARPRALLRETREEAAHELVVEPVRTVEDDTVHS